MHSMLVARLDNYPPESENIYLVGLDMEEMDQFLVLCWRTWSILAIRSTHIKRLELYCKYLPIDQKR